MNPNIPTVPTNPNAPQQHQQQQQYPAMTPQMQAQYQYYQQTQYQQQHHYPTTALPTQPPLNSHQITLNSQQNALNSHQNALNSHQTAVNSQQNTQPVVGPPTRPTQPIANANANLTGMTEQQRKQYEQQRLLSTLNGATPAVTGATSSSLTPSNSSGNLATYDAQQQHAAAWAAYYAQQAQSNQSPPHQPDTTTPSVDASAAAQQWTQDQYALYQAQWQQYLAMNPDAAANMDPNQTASIYRTNSGYDLTAVSGYSVLPLPDKVAATLLADETIGEPGKKLPIWRSNVTFNMPEIMYKNIKLSGYYVQELHLLADFNELREKAKRDIKCLEPWVGSSRNPTTIWCILWKCFKLGLTKKQVNNMLHSQQSIYLRALALLYVRFCVEPDTQWELYQDSLYDEDQVRITAKKDTTISIAQFCHDLISKNKFFDVMLPRIPVPKQRKWMKALADMENGGDGELDVVEEQEIITAPNDSKPSSRNRSRSPKSSSRARSRSPNSRRAYKDKDSHRHRDDRDRHRHRSHDRDRDR